MNELNESDQAAIWSLPTPTEDYRNLLPEPINISEYFVARPLANKKSTNEEYVTNHLKPKNKSFKSHTFFKIFFFILLFKIKL